MPTLKPSLHFRHSQQLAITPQLRQSLKFLGLSCADLHREIQDLINSNPILEIEESTDDELQSSRQADFIDDPMSIHIEEADDKILQPYTTTSSFQTAKVYNDAPLFEQENIVSNESLSDHLRGQLASNNIKASDQTWIAFLIDNLDENGYLQEDFKSLKNQLPSSTVWCESDFDRCLRHLQEMEPSGVGSRNLRESLLIQVQRHSSKNKATDLAHKLLLKYFNELINHDYHKVEKLEKIDSADLAAALGFISTLKPRPAANFSRSPISFVTPDVKVEKIHNSWEVSLVETSIPKLSVHKNYVDAIDQSKTTRNTLLEEKVREAKATVKSVRQRSETVLSVAKEIVRYQEKFFDIGPAGMRPLKLSIIAKKLELHESTVSRATNQKYMLTPFGTMELKTFFSQEISSGQEISSYAIHNQIKQLIISEDKIHPLSDNRIRELLKASGVSIARRTVTKYREQLNILSAKQRKEIKIKS